MTSGTDLKRAQPDVADDEDAADADADLLALRRAVLDGAEALWRDLPWRSTRDPWLVLVSEVMLQQTQASRVVEAFLRFTSAYPTPLACAAAGVGDVVRAWRGLGYNGRAVRLHRAATAIAERHGGTVPKDLDALLSLPGVGPYTARAVLAFAYEAPVAVVDTNVARVLTRAVAGRPLRPAEAQALADRLVAPRAPWRFNQALFDLGAQRCTARAPRCAECRLSHRCRWVLAPAGTPDPAGEGRRTQGVFEGSDRQGRGRLVDALRTAPVPRARLAAVAGWPDDEDRARRTADAALVDGGLATWAEDALVLA